MVWQEKKNHLLRDETLAVFPSRRGAVDRVVELEVGVSGRLNTTTKKKQAEGVGKQKALFDGVLHLHCHVESSTTCIAVQ